MTERIPVDEVRRLARDVFRHSATSAENAGRVAGALVDAELVGQTGHGLRRVASYADQARSGKVDGHATPTATYPRPGAMAVDAGNGFAQPALDLVVENLPVMAQQNGIAVAGIHHSHHAGVLGLTVERLAEAGVAALFVANTPPAIAPWGGHEALYGTNPIAFATPVDGAEPIVVDLSLSKVARGKIMAAEQAGESIPADWALDPNGQPTTEPAQALAGVMLPMGDAKGAALALLVEVLAGGVAGANFSYEASSFFTAGGPPPGVGQLLIALDPRAFNSAVGTRLAELVHRIEQVPGARVPGHQRQELRQQLTSAGIPIDDALLAELRRRASNGE